MYKLTQLHRGSALLVGLVIVILLTILTTSFLDKILNLGKTSGGIDNSAQSYSLATGLIEEQLMTGTMTKQEPWNVTERAESFASTGRTLKASTGGTWIPMGGKGNSPFDPDWNIIGMGEPVQVVIPSNVAWGTVDFQFRVPSIGASNTGVVATMTNSGIILWTFGYSGASLYASGETQIFVGQLIDGAGHKIDGYIGNTNTGSTLTFAAFYNDPTVGVGNNGAKCTTSFKCTLKLSMLRPFLTAGGQSFSFLEYRINFGGTILPSQYMVIDSSAYIRGYLRSRQVRIPQITTDTANDFAVLQ